MKEFRYDNSQLLEAFIKSAQYFVRLKTQQDVWDHLGKFILTYFPADWIAFARRDRESAVSIHHCTLPEEVAAQCILKDEIRILIADVLDSGFLASQVILTPEPSMTVFLPIVEDYRTEEVMLIGNKSADPLPNELLNIYLAIAGLAGTTCERLHNEHELNMHRTHLEELVKERTAELAKAKQQNELILLSVREGICGLDLDGRITFVNPFAAQMLNWDQAELIGREAHATFHHKRKNDCPFPIEDCPVYSTLTNGRTNYATEEEFLRKDGTPFPVEFTTASILKENSTVGAVIVFRDITERKRADEALRDSEQRYATTLASIGDAVIATDVEGSVTFMNGVAEELTGWTLDEASQKPAKAVFNIINEYTLQKVDDPVTKVLENGAIVGLANHTILIRRDGSEVAIDDSGAPIKDRNGSITGVVLVFRDITERKQVEQELQESNQRFRLALKNAPVSVATQDKDLRFIWAYNQRTLMPEDVVGKTDNDVFIQGDAARLIALKHKVIETGTEVREQLWLTLNGKPIYLDLYLEPIRDAAEDITGIGIATVDLTPMKVVEDELHKAREDLELKVQERTADLQNAKEELGVTNEELRIELEQHSKLEADLIKAKETAEESVRAKSAFLANMSHELRTPMNAVIGFSSLLLDDSLTPEQKEFIEGIRKGGEALLAIIDDILEFSRVEKDKIELERQPFSLKHVIDESLDLVATQAGKKGLNLSKTIGYGTPDTIIGDHGRLRQILVNLLGNAVKFTDKGDVSVSVSSKVLKGDERQISFAVKDTGIGIPQDKMNEIFEPFVQVERTLSLKRDGVGLGLAITRNLVELMGGTIWAESIPGQGTTFSFRIPAETIPGKQLYFGRMDSGIASESLSGLKPMRILVAEDNPSNQRVLVEMLKRLGYRPDAVADGREVVQALERQDYDLVLMDIKMPEMDGITATQVIRKLRPENGPKIVAITAFALEGDREKCLEAGMDDYISKPVKMEELAEVLKEMRFDPVTKSRAPE